ncbi:hypothetical protein F6X40_10550 [Paraburkholderia sp. UCT31]|uniref:hypothetical protein n=1 Tax=Paraburkholderia sp. UCT31 TaxID=2615209 RepID=UPI001655CCCC|nr:hypothetical protein [Paraburkholderia sp. UCT31]MBC8737247.1 hypothetical protein [Paraburkholderia sp. UCT31]
MSNGTINGFYLLAEIKKIDESIPKDPTKKPSAVLLCQYGVQRDESKGPVDFVNAVLVRVPSYKYPELRDTLKVGQRILINGRLQGVAKPTGDGRSYLTVELVTERITIDGGLTEQ